MRSPQEVVQGMVTSCSVGTASAGEAVSGLWADHGTVYALMVAGAHKAWLQDVVPPQLMQLRYPDADHMTK